MPKLEDIVSKNEDGTVSVTLTDNRIAVVADLPASAQFTIDSATIPELMGMRAVFATKRIGEQDIKISSSPDYGRALDVIGSSTNLNRIIGAFALNFAEPNDGAAFTEDAPNASATVTLVEGGTATIRELTARKQSIADALTPQVSSLVAADTRAMLALVDINGTPVSISTRKDLDDALVRLGSGRNLDRLARAYELKFTEDIDLPNS